MLHKLSFQIDAFVKGIMKGDLSREQWIVVSVVVLGAGFMMLRGLGGRSNL